MTLSRLIRMIIGGILIITMMYQLEDGKSIYRNGVSSTGTVISCTKGEKSTLTYYCTVKYTGFIDRKGKMPLEKEYTTSGKIWKNYMPGTPISIHYDQNDNSKCVIDDGCYYDSMGMMQLLFLGIILFVSGILPFISKNNYICEDRMITKKDYIKTTLLIIITISCGYRIFSTFYTQYTGINTTGTVKQVQRVNNKTNDTYNIAVEYEVDGNKYYISGNSVLGKSEGSKVVVHYKKDDPSSAVIDETSDYESFILPIIFICTIIMSVTEIKKLYRYKKEFKIQYNNVYKNYKNNISPE